MATVSPVKARIEALKEFARVIIFAVVGAALAAAGAASSLLPDPWMQVGVVALVTALGKAWDKYTHKSDSTTVDGVIPF